MLAAILSGLFGTVSRGPIVPVCQAGQPCSQPAAGLRLTFVRDGHAVKSVVTSSTGRYRVLLPPGTYSVRIARASRIERLKPTSVAVHRGAMTHRSFFIDTGIR